MSFLTVNAAMPGTSRKQRDAGMYVCGERHALDNRFPIID
jgi:hypothetical protein